MKLFVALLVLLVTPCRAEEGADIQLMAAGEMLQPGRTLEFRFATAMVAADQLGLSKPPVVFDPDWPGTFTWLSTRSGVFVPTEVPPLGVKFVIRARGGLKNFAGSPVGSRFRAEVSTPSFEAVAATKFQVIGNEAQPNTSAIFIFNLHVSLDRAARLFRFRDASGATVPAEVSYASAQGDMGGSKPGEEDWERRWRESIRPSAPQTEGADEIKNRLRISPASPLPVGNDWKLEMSPGLRSLDGKSVTKTPYELPLGNVSPLRLKSLLATHYIHSGCGLVMDFSAEIAPDITPETAGEFFRITPPVEKLRFEIAWRQCLVSGDFEVGKDYELHVGEGVVSDNGVPFAGKRTVKFRFAPVPPRLYLPEITGHQVLA